MRGMVALLLMLALSACGPKSEEIPGFGKKLLTAEDLELTISTEQWTTESTVRFNSERAMWTVTLEPAHPSADGSRNPTVFRMNPGFERVHVIFVDTAGKTVSRDTMTRPGSDETP